MEITPDFLVNWRNDSSLCTQSVYCVTPAPAQLPGGGLRKVIATLHTRTTHVEVSEVTLTESTTLTVVPNRPGFCLLIATSSPVIEYGYLQEANQTSKQGCVLFMVPGKELHSYSAPGTTSTVTCSFDRQYAQGTLGPMHLSTSKLHSSLDVRSSLIASMLLRLMREALCPGPMSHLLVQSLGHAMLIECAHWLSMEDSQLTANGLTARHLQIIEEYSAASGGSPRVAELAAACGLSQRHFAKLFSERVGCSVAQYSKSVQLAKAKAYLLETGLPLKAIAHQLGFSSPANFCSAFRTATGSTPGQFRKKK